MFANVSSSFTFGHVYKLNHV